MQMLSGRISLADTYGCSSGAVWPNAKVFLAQDIHLNSLSYIERRPTRRVLFHAHTTLSETELTQQLLLHVCATALHWLKKNAC